MNEARAKRIAEILQHNGWSVDAVQDKNWDGASLWGVRFRATDVVYYDTYQMPEVWQNQVLKRNRERS